MGYPEKREIIIQGFRDLLDTHSIKPDLIAGTATAGIPHASWLAHETKLPMVYVRSKAKEHGRKNQIEGPIEAGQSAVIIEDLISTGKSSIAAVRAVVEAGAKVDAVLSIFSYGFDLAAEAFESASVPQFVLTTFDTLLQVAIKEGRLAPDDQQTLQSWRADPQAWSDTFTKK